MSLTRRSTVLRTNGVHFVMHIEVVMGKKEELEDRYQSRIAEKIRKSGEWNLHTRRFCYITSYILLPIAAKSQIFYQRVTNYNLSIWHRDERLYLFCVVRGLGQRIFRDRHIPLLCSYVMLIIGCCGQNKNLVVLQCFLLKASVKI